MNIVQAAMENLAEIMSFYDVMCHVLGQQSFLPDGDKGGFPSKNGKKAIESGCQFIGIENDQIVAAYILNHDCDSAYHTVRWAH